VFKALSGRSVYVTGNYRSANGSKCVSCAMGASEGHLYPLNKSFIFIHKPTKVIGFDEIDCVEFQRYV
jgi:structure-specific recognition protein 1